MSRRQTVEEVGGRYAETVSKVLEPVEAVEALTLKRPCLSLTSVRVTCLGRERVRPYGRESVRPTQHMDPQRMCDECALHWHMTMAGIYARRLASHEHDAQVRR